MLMSSTLCRAQEARHHRIAADTPLGNVRAIALRAASVWRAEAEAAERREQRQVRAAAGALTAPPVESGVEAMSG